MLPIEMLHDSLWAVAKARAAVELLRKQPDVAQDCKRELDSARWSLETAGAELINAIAAQTLKDHLAKEVQDRSTANA